jgi:adenylate cyclase
MSPDELMTLLVQYEQRLVPVIQRFGGSIDKFLGDGIMATFGAAVPNPAHAANALRAVHALGRVAEDWREERKRDGLPPLEIGFAVAAGRLVFGAVGDETRLEFTVIGEPVNRAAKLEQANKSEHVRALTDAATYALAEAQGYGPERPHQRRADRPVAGLAEPLDLVVLLP